MLREYSYDKLNDCNCESSWIRLCTSSKIILDFGVRQLRKKRLKICLVQSVMLVKVRWLWLESLITLV